MTFHFPHALSVSFLVSFLVYASLVSLSFGDMLYVNMLMYPYAYLAYGIIIFG